MMRATVLALLLMVSACSQGGSGASDTGPGAPDAVRRGDLEVMNIVAPAPAPSADSTSTVAAYFQVMNRGSEADTLYRVEAADGRPSMHDQAVRGARQAMVPILDAVLPAGTMLRFAPGGRHVMIEGVRRPLAAGDSVPLTLYFRRAGRIPVTARVVEYAQLEGVLGKGADAHAGH
ncbi:MAG: copper chaperone PCu(A)C [Gemmatimonadaceae bacterium]|nr:copper chaperone PCu(A)C [Gemmatimonadaceae bacterium]